MALRISIVICAAVVGVLVAFTVLLHRAEPKPLYIEPPEYFLIMQNGDRKTYAILPTERRMNRYIEQCKALIDCVVIDYGEVQ